MDKSFEEGWTAAQPEQREKIAAGKSITIRSFKTKGS